MRNITTDLYRQRGDAAGGLIKLIVVVVIFFVLLGPALKWLQSLPEKAEQATSHVVDNVQTSISREVSNGWDNFKQKVGNGLSNIWNGLKEKLLGASSGLQKVWDGLTPAQKFDFVCNHTPAEGLSQLCPFFSGPLQAASDAEASQVSCYWQALADSPIPDWRKKHITQLVTAPDGGNPPSPRLMEQRLRQQVIADGNVYYANCQATAPKQWFTEVRAMLKPAADQCMPIYNDTLKAKDRERLCKLFNADSK